MKNLVTVILAAGKGTRMNSSLPKVLHPIADKSMLQHVLDTTQSLKAKKNIVVYGHGKAELENALSGQNVELAYQAEQLGTGHAVKQALPLIDDNDSVLILYADTPLVSKETLDQLIQHYPENGIALLTVKLDDPTGYGRILRHNDTVVGIVEQKDATKDQLAINEVNTGIMLVSGKQLRKWLNQLNNNNQQKEYYLTDIIGFAHQDGYEIATSHPSSEIEVEGVNNRLQQAKLERYYQSQQAEKLMLAGVTLKDPNRFDLRGVLNHGKDVIIDTNVVIEGHVTLGDNVTIESGVILKNCTIGNDCIISAYSVIENASLDEGCTVGPFARLRPGADLKAKAHVGNFVEIKNAVLGEGSKAGHLSYLGDSEIGTEVNIGAGTITCNYDGANKHKTIIGDRVFVGSDTQLVAPVTVGNDVTIAAGTTVTKNVSEGALVLSRVKQSEIQGWKRPKKNK